MEYQDFSKLSEQQQLAAVNAGAHAVTGMDTPITFEQAWANISRANQVASEVLEGNQVDLQTLIEQAKDRLAAGGTKVVDGEKLPTVEAGDKATVKQVHALAEEAKRARDEAAKQYDVYKQVLKDMLGDEETAAEVLTVNNVPIFTWKKSTTTTLNQAAIKAQFPIEQYPDFYTTQERRTALLK